MGGEGTTMTDASGNWSVSVIQNGTYTVTPSKSGFTFTPAGRTATVSGASVTGVNFTAQPIPTFTLSGTITDGVTNSNVGATVTLSGGASASTTTDTSGNYAFTGLVNGTY